MRLLILGGTMFLGRHAIDDALARGHDVTLFHRGKTNADLYPELEHILGDRTADVSALRGREFDAVIDTCGYHPRDVTASAEAVRDTVGHYVFVSTISVYADVSKPGVTEDAPVETIADPANTELSNETYGGLKALCEQAAEEAMPGRVTVVRPGLIVGPYDPSDRFTYWPVRVARGGEVLAPAPADQPVQIVDARDLAAFLVTAAEKRLTGTYNSTSPGDRFTLGEVLSTSAAVAGTSPSFTWVPTDFLDAQEVGMWMELPLVVWGEGYEGFNQVDVSRAVAAGHEFRPLADTVSATLDWFAAQEDRPLRAGLAAEREAEVLKAWRAMGDNPGHG
jgi:2'-hydroxyisoflavone reductase